MKRLVATKVIGLHFSSNTPEFNHKSLCSKLIKLLFPLYLLTVTLKCLAYMSGRFLLSLFVSDAAPN